MRILYGEDDLRADNIERISYRIRDEVKPGYYRRILSRVANVEHTQVNSLDTPVFMETEQPDLLCQDLNFKVLSSDLDLEAIAEVTGTEVGSLDDLHGAIDWCFETYGPRAIAVKNPSAYRRRLDYVQVSAGEAAPVLVRYLKNQELVTNEEESPHGSCFTTVSRGPPNMTFPQSSTPVTTREPERCPYTAYGRTRPISATC